MSWDDDDAPASWEDFNEDQIVIPTPNKDAPKESWDDEDEEEETHPAPPPASLETKDSKPKEKKPKTKKKPKNKQKAPQNPSESVSEAPKVSKEELDKIVKKADFENARDIFSGLNEEEPLEKEESPKPKYQPQRVEEFREEFDDDEEDYETAPKSQIEKPKAQAPKAKAKSVIQADINIEETVADLVKKMRPLTVNPQFFRCYKSLIQSATRSLSADEMKEIAKVFTNVSNSKIVQQSDKKKKAAKPARQQLNIREDQGEVYDEMF